MRTITLHRYWVTAPGRKREYLTSFPMTAQDAEAQYPGCRPEPSTRIEREVPDTQDERARAMVEYQSAGRDSVKPPRQ